LVYTVSEKNMQTLASCNFDKYGLILIILGKQHQHTFKSDKHIQFSLSLHFYLLTNKESISKGTRKVQHAYHFREYADAIYPRLSKLVHARRNYSLLNLAHFFLRQM